MSDAYCVYVDYVRDLRRDPVVRWVDRWYWLWVAASWVIPGFIGLAWYGTADGYWAGFFAGGPLRTLWQLNCTWAVNSIAHCFGRRRFETREDSRNSALVNTLTMNGEGLHNNHHAFPWSASFALFPGEIDPGYWVLRGFVATGLGVKGACASPAPDCSAGRSADDWSLALEYQPIERKGAGEIGIQARLEIMDVIAHHLAPHQRNQIGLLAPQIP